MSKFSWKTVSEASFETDVQAQTLRFLGQFVVSKLQHNFRFDNSLMVPGPSPPLASLSASPTTHFNSYAHSCGSSIDAIRRWAVWTFLIYFPENLKKLSTGYIMEVL